MKQAIVWAVACGLTLTGCAMWGTDKETATIWFKNSQSAEFASCSLHSCENGECVWRVRLYSRADGQWRVRSEYNLGRPRR